MDTLFASKGFRIISIASIVFTISTVVWALFLKSPPATSEEVRVQSLEAPVNPSPSKLDALQKPAVDAGAAPSPSVQELQAAKAAQAAQYKVNTEVTTLNAAGKNYAAKPPIEESDNLIANPGFEDGLEPWVWLDWSRGWSGFVHSDAHAYEGKHSLLLPVHSMDARPTIVWGGVQEVTLTADVPECLEGYYYVENWTKGDWKQYLQIVLIDLSKSLGARAGNAQLRYIISGEKEPPLSISNAQYLFIEKERRDHPVIGAWTKFTLNAHEDFMKHWNYTPEKGHVIRLLFEARFDGHHPNHPEARAAVYFDNLYFGPKTATRCAD